MYGMIMRVQKPIEDYNARHAAVAEAMGTNDPEGLVAHIARATDEGYELIEVWETKEQADVFIRDIVVSAAQRIGAPLEDGPEPEVIEFEPAVTLTPRPFNSDQQQ